MENKLISMVDFVLSLSGKQSDLTTIYNYAKFLKQPLTLGMFVPCRSDGKPLETPIEPEAPYNDKKCDIWQQYEFYKNRYEEAKEAVLFEDVEIHDFPDGSHFMTASKIQIANFSKDFSNIYWHYDIIEHLANDYEDATLTPTALKTIYG